MCGGVVMVGVILEVVWTQLGVLTGAHRWSNLVNMQRQVKDGKNKSFFFKIVILVMF